MPQRNKHQKEESKRTGYDKIKNKNR